MRLKIQLSYNSFTVPMSYQSILQGVIYSLLSKDELGDFYHNDGYHYDKKTFKCFTFSQLFGKYKIENKHLIFDDDFYFYISSLDEKFLKHIYKTILLNNSLLINKQQVKIKNISILNLQPFIGTKKICIETNFETLSLIYNCGLSSKNSCGFGMIDIAHEKSNISL